MKKSCNVTKYGKNYQKLIYKLRASPVCKSRFDYDEIPQIEKVLSYFGESAGKIVDSLCSSDESFSDFALEFNLAQQLGDCGIYFEYEPSNFNKDAKVDFYIPNLNGKALVINVKNTRAGNPEKYRKREIAILKEESKKTGAEASKEVHFDGLYPRENPPNKQTYLNGKQNSHFLENMLIMSSEGSTKDWSDYELGILGKIENDFFQRRSCQFIQKKADECILVIGNDSRFYKTFPTLVLIDWIVKAYFGERNAMITNIHRHFEQKEVKKDLAGIIVAEHSGNRLLYNDMKLWGKSTPSLEEKIPIPSFDRLK